METVLDMPPYTNRGAQNTEGLALRSCVDWVQATFKCFTSPHELIELLGFEISNFYDTKNGKYGYSKGKKMGNITIYYQGTPEMGIHIEMSGQGCREYEELQILTWSQLFLEFFKYEANFTRLDVAIDDFKGYFSIPALISKIKKGQLVSKFKKAVEMNTIDIGSGDTKGTTIYYGASSSRVQIRMYQKNHERQNKGFELEQGVEVWNRTEIQLRDERADTMAVLIATEYKELFQLTAGVLRHYLRFVNQPSNGDTNKSRWKTSPFWIKFLDGVEKLRLSEVAPDRTVQRTFNWVSKQVTPSLAILFHAFDGDMDLLTSLVVEGSERLSDKDKNMIVQFKKQNPNFELKDVMPLLENIKNTKKDLSPER